MPADASTDQPCHVCTRRPPDVTGGEPLRLCQHHRAVADLARTLPTGIACPDFTVPRPTPRPDVPLGPGPVFDGTAPRWCVLTGPHGTEHIDQHGEPWSTADAEDDDL